MMIATVNVLTGCTLIHFALISLRDALLLAAAIRDRGSDPASLSAE